MNSLRYQCKRIPGELHTPKSGNPIVFAQTLLLSPRRGFPVRWSILVPRSTVLCQQGNLLCSRCCSDSLLALEPEQRPSAQTECIENMDTHTPMTYAARYRVYVSGVSGDEDE
jgi:hypothetical protein